MLNIFKHITFRYILADIFQYRNLKMCPVPVF